MFDNFLLFSVSYLILWTPGVASNEKGKPSHFITNGKRFRGRKADFLLMVDRWTRLMVGSQRKDKPTTT